MKWTDNSVTAAAYDVHHLYLKMEQRNVEREKL